MLPLHSTKDVLKRWFIRNAQYPYPNDEVTDRLSEFSGLSRKQLSQWFLNVRKRHWLRLARQLRFNFGSELSKTEKAKMQTMLLRSKFFQELADDPEFKDLSAVRAR